MTRTHVGGVRAVAFVDDGRRSVNSIFMFLLIFHIPLRKHYKILQKKDLCRTDPYPAIKLTKICSRLPKSETLREQAGDLVRYSGLMQKFEISRN